MDALDRPDGTGLIELSRRRARIVEALPDLVGALEPVAARLAEQRLTANTFTVRAGRWIPDRSLGAQPGHLGLLVLDGLLARDVVLQRPLATELVGAGDLLRPRDRDGQDAPIPFDIGWRILQPARIAVLDPGFARVAGQWPEVIEFLLQAAVARAHSIAVSAAISHLRHVEKRVLCLMWYLADRWGRVHPDGVVVPLKLTHATLAQLVGAQRPSVTIALKALAGSGRMVRRDNRSWLLIGGPPRGWSVSTPRLSSLLTLDPRQVSQGVASGGGTSVPEVPPRVSSARRHGGAG